ncbi:MAG TPA: ABC transporter substrate-binding protein [Thermoleophilaceae bacterium]|nr:ABC transporter substrate-binding protein [Thermoleophilaceae bacterium]
MNKKLASAGAILACVALTAVGCGSSGSKSGGGTTVAGVGNNAKVVTPQMAQNPKGNVTWCIGKDTTGAFSQVVKLYNQANPQVHVKLLELPTSADQQHSQLVQREQAKSSECDVLGMDVIWTAEFAAQGWLRDVSPAIQARQSEFIPSTLDTAKINGKYWAIPFNTNAGFLYWNTSKVHQAPQTWQQAYQMAKTDGGLGYQGARYEGLTVDFLELLYSNGGSVLSSDGKKATIDSPQAEQVLSFMQQGIKNGAVPRSNSTWMEEESRNAFQSGKVALLRNWPYVYALAKQAHVKFNLAPLPKFGSGQPASILGGYNLGISTYSKNPGAALSFINFATGPAAQKKFFIKSSLPAVLTQTYNDPGVKKAQPFAPELLKAVQQGKPRPVSPVYPQISQAIYNNVYSALSSGTPPKTALKNAQNQINKALQTF